VLPVINTPLQQLVRMIKVYVFIVQLVGLVAMIWLSREPDMYPFQYARLILLCLGSVFCTASGLMRNLRLQFGLAAIGIICLIACFQPNLLALADTWLTRH
jgi:hypothetical protein